MKKLGTEKKIKTDNLTVKIGTTNKQNPLVLYAEYGMFIEPIIETNFTNSIKAIRNKVGDIGKEIAEYAQLSNSMMSITDVSVDRIFVGKKSFVSIQYYFRNTNNKPYRELSDKISFCVSSKYTELVDFIESNGFICSKTKK